MSHALRRREWHSIPHRVRQSPEGELPAWGDTTKRKGKLQKRGIQRTINRLCGAGQWVASFACAAHRAAGSFVKLRPSRERPRISPVAPPNVKFLLNGANRRVGVTGRGAASSRAHAVALRIATES